MLNLENAVKMLRELKESRHNCETCLYYKNKEEKEKYKKYYGLSESPCMGCFHKSCNWKLSDKFIKKLIDVIKKDNKNE